VVARAARLRLGALDLRVLLAVLERTVLWSKLADETSTRAIARSVYGLDDASEPPGWARRNISNSLVALRARGLIEYEPSRGPGARAMIRIPRSASSDAPSTERSASGDAPSGSIVRQNARKSASDRGHSGNYPGNDARAARIFAALRVWFPAARVGDDELERDATLYARDGLEVDELHELAASCAWPGDLRRRVRERAAVPSSTTSARPTPPPCGICGGAGVLFDERANVARPCAMCRPRAAAGPAAEVADGPAVEVLERELGARAVPR
jgi:hypothetical protein